MLCDGALLDINTHQALYSLLGTRYGGDGKTKFGLPDLRGRVPIGPGISNYGTVYNLGDKGGQESVVLANTNVPSHGHSMTGVVANGTAPTPAGGYPSNTVSMKTGSTTVFPVYLPSAEWKPDTALTADSIAPAGASAAHNNMQPFTVMGFMICVVGLYPSHAD